jgi:glucan phosphoethanolaminetransferase (alkaline phosphatase superfamily)
MKVFLSFKFWFNLRPGILVTQNYVLAVFAVFVILTILFAILKKRQAKTAYRQLWESIYSFGFYNALICLALLFFTYELVPFLSARFWFLLWGIGIIVWIYFLVKKFQQVKVRKEQLAKEKEFKKYIP